jgi:maleylpyruvate isomerase
VSFSVDIIDAPDAWRLELTAATQRLLGDTIALSDNDWRDNTLLPSWSRACVATHLAFHAEALTEMTQTLIETRESVTWRSHQRDEEIWMGARRNAIALQEALDQSSTVMFKALDQMDDHTWEIPVTTSHGPLPATTLVLDRLNEVIVHHIDLQLGVDFADIEPELVRLLLKWNIFRATPRFSQVELTIITDEGYSTTVGSGTPSTVRGTEVSLLGWITGRKDSSSILGAEELNLIGPI